MNHGVTRNWTQLSPHTVYVHANSKLLISSPALSPLVTMFVRTHHVDDCSPFSGRKDKNGQKEP